MKPTLDEQPAIDSWVHTDTIDPWLRIVSGVCGFSFDELDSTVVSIGLSETRPDDDDAWYEHLLDGDQTILVRMAEAASDERVLVRVWCPEDLSERVELATWVAQRYRIRLRGIEESVDVSRRHVSKVRKFIKTL